MHLWGGARKISAAIAEEAFWSEEKRKPIALVANIVMGFVTE
jgi:hypothetical protein